MFILAFLYFLVVIMIIGAGVELGILCYGFWYYIKGEMKNA